MIPAPIPARPSFRPYRGVTAMTTPELPPMTSIRPLLEVLADHVAQVAGDRELDAAMVAACDREAAEAAEAHDG